MSEQGFPFDTDGWYGVFAPAATPAPIVERLNAAVNRIVAAPELRERFRQFNMPDDPPLKTPGEFAQTVRNDIKVWSAIVEANNIRLE